MRFTTDDDALSITFDLDDDDPENLDLTAGDLGAQILGAAADGMVDSARRERSPAGDPWPQLKPATVTARERKGYGPRPIGYNSGSMLRNLDRGRTTITPRSATWTYPQGDRFEIARRFHGGNDAGQLPRPLIGWTDDAQDEARRLIAAAAG